MTVVHSTLYAGCSNIHSSLFHKSMMVMCVNVHSTLYAKCSNIHSHSLIFPGIKKQSYIIHMKIHLNQ